MNSLKDSIGKFLGRHQLALVIWALTASFGAYFCMYGFRKPFNTGLYEGLELWGVSYKTILILTQVAGYMVSKFVGIKIISELKASKRTLLAIAFIGIAHFALLLFGWVPYPYNFVFLFLNGLPLGMVYGVLFSYLEGRRVTETIVMGLGISIIVASGVLKTIYIDLHQWLPQVSEFWMPFLMGCLFLPFFFFFMWMMSVLPPPDQQDIANRTIREPMNREDKRAVLKSYGIPIFSYVVIYAMLTMVRDFRDNFAVEIWNEIESGWESKVLAQTELITGIVVLVAIGSLSLVKDNRIGFGLINAIMLGGLLIAAAFTFLFREGVVSGYQWMLWLGIGTFLAYITAQTVLFERMIALFRIKANAGFMVYLCDSTGYLGSVILLIYKEFFTGQLPWSEVLSSFVKFQTLAGVVLMLLSIYFLYRKGKSNDVLSKAG